jgi:hypothetical protein
MELPTHEHPHSGKHTILLSQAVPIMLFGDIAPLLQGPNHFVVLLGRVNT